MQSETWHKTASFTSQKSIYFDLNAELRFIVVQLNVVSGFNLEITNDQWLRKKNLERGPAPRKSTFWGGFSKLGGDIFNA